MTSMRKTINLIIIIIMSILSISSAIIEAYFIIIKNIFGMNVLKYALCGTVCFIVLKLINLILSIFIKYSKEDHVYDPIEKKEDIRTNIGWVHIITFLVASIIMVMFFIDGNSKILGLILVNFFTLLLHVVFNSNAGGIENNVLGVIYNKHGDKVGEIRKY